MKLRKRKRDKREGENSIIQDHHCHHLHHGRKTAAKHHHRVYVDEILSAERRASSLLRVGIEKGGRKLKENGVWNGRGRRRQMPRWAPLTNPREPSCPGTSRLRCREER
jgi:hypothetical protein